VRGQRPVARSSIVLVAPCQSDLMHDPLVVLAVGAVLGLVLGTLGGGGGVLAVPLLVALGEPVLVASTMSLVIISSGAAAALVPHHRAHRVDWSVGLTFGALGSVGAILGARAAQLAAPGVQLAGLAVLLVVGGVAMLRAAATARRSDLSAPSEQIVMAGGAVLPMTAPTASVAVQRTTATRWRIVVLATGVGLVTGFFGVGAGFVVVPALVSAMGLPIKRATATALVVIVINSAVALSVRHADLGPTALTATLAATTAVFAILGALVSRRIPGWQLSAGFGALMLAMAVFTVVRAIAGS